jgi:hypothetical protein
MGRKSCLLYLFILMFRMNDECVLSCPLNYENTSETVGKGYVCTPKQCEDRIPWSNGSCSMEEDFRVEGGGEAIECYLWKVRENMENCVVKSDCPSGFPGVCFSFFFVCTNICFIWGCNFFLD